MGQNLDFPIQNAYFLKKSVIFWEKYMKKANFAIE